jgi:thioredoxin-like negative regulator of GroEL
VRLAPEQIDLRLALAKACIAANEHEKAQSVLESLLKQEPGFPGASELLRDLRK